MAVLGLWGVPAASRPGGQPRIPRGRDRADRHRRDGRRMARGRPSPAAFRCGRSSRLSSGVRQDARLRLPESSDRLVLAAVTAVAGLLRLAYGLFPRVVRWDEAGHLLVASNLVAGRGYSELAGTLDAHLPPFLPVVSASLLKLGLSPEWATATVHIVTGALLCIPIFLLGRAIYGRRAGFLAAVLVAVYPALAAWPYLWSTMTESPFLLFVFSGVWAVYRSLHSEPPRHSPAHALVRGRGLLVRPGLSRPPGRTDLFCGAGPLHGGMAPAQARHSPPCRVRTADAGRRSLPHHDQSLRALPPLDHRPLAPERQGRADPRHCARLPRQ